jgi:hypothetical protein
MTRPQAIAIIQYISRAHGIIPTTGAEWDMIRPGLEILERAANGRTELKEAKPEPTEVKQEAS